MRADTAHHESCEMCGQQFFGYTDADLLAHYKAEHNDIAETIADRLELDATEVVECNTCGKEFTTYGGECPYCGTN
jgi:hypothetical protein